MKTKRNCGVTLDISESGFTLVELMIALFVGGIVLIGLSFTFQKQSDMKVIQEDVTEILQNARVARSVITRNLRRAGYYGDNGPSPGDRPLYPIDYGNAIDTNNPPPGQLVSTSLVTRFWEDNPVGAAALPLIKTVGFDIYDSVIDNDNDPSELSYISSTTVANQPAGSTYAAEAPRLPLIKNVEAIEFVYLLNDGTNAVITESRTVPATAVEDVQAVRVTMLLRGKFDRSGQGVFDHQIYRNSNGSSWGPFDDGFKRRIMEFTVSLRNN